MDRRQFVAACGAAAVAPVAAKDPPAMPPVVDTHQHLWDLARVRLAWLKPGHELGRSFTPPDYAEATAGLGVAKAVYMEVDVVPEDQQKEADYVVALCGSGKTPTCAAVLGGHPDAPGFADYVRQFKGSKHVKGIRRVLHADSTPAGHGLRPEFVKGVRLLGDLGLSFDLCARWAELGDMAKLVGQCPGTRFILDHCGNPSVKFTPDERDRWRRGLAEVAARPNVVCKVSGFVVNAGKGPWAAADLAPYVNATIDTFGVDRVMFGGDWPVVTLAATYKDWLAMLRQILSDRPEADQRKVLHDNAIQFYGI